MSRAPARRRARALAAGAVAVLLLAVAVPRAWAYFTDTAAMEAGPFAAHTVAPPASASCSAALLTVTVSWTDPAVGYDYEAVLRRADGSVVSTRAVTGTATSVTYTGLTDFGIVGLGTFDFTVEVRSRLASAPTWTSAGVRTVPVRVLALVVGATASCL